MMPFLLFLIFSLTNGQEVVQFPVAWELITHTVLGSGNVTIFPMLEADIRLHSHHTLQVAIDATVKSGDTSTKRRKSYTRYVNYWSGNFYQLTDTTRGPSVSSADPDKSEAFELRGPADKPAEPKTETRLTCKDRETTGQCIVLTEKNRTLHASINVTKIVATIKNDLNVAALKLEIFSPQEWTSGANDEAWNLMLVDLKSVASQRVPIREVSYRRISIEKGKSGPENDITGRIRFERDVVPLTMAQLKRNSKTAVGSKGSLLVIDRHDLGSVKFHFIEEMSLVSNTDNNDLKAINSHRGVGILNHLMAQTIPSGSVDFPDNHIAKDHCFSFRPHAAQADKKSLKIYEGNFVTEVTLDDDAAQTERGHRIPITIESSARLGKNYWDAVVNTRQNGQFKFANGEVFKDGNNVGKYSEVFPGLPADTVRIDAAWWRRKDELLYLFIDERYWTFMPSADGWKPKTVGELTQRDLTPFVQPLWDTIITLPVSEIGTKKAIRKTFFFANGYFFSIVDHDKDHSDEIDQNTKLSFALSDGTDGGFVKVADWCGTRYSIQGFNVADHVKKMAAFHSKWYPGLESIENTNSHSSSAIIYVVIVGLLLVLIAIGVAAYFYRNNLFGRNLGTQRHLRSTSADFDIGTGRMTLRSPFSLTTSTTEHDFTVRTEKSQ